MVNEATREEKVTGSNLAGRVARDFYAKNTRLATETGRRGLFFLFFSTQINFSTIYNYF